MDNDAGVGTETINVERLDGQGNPITVSVAPEKSRKKAVAPSPLKVELMVYAIVHPDDPAMTSYRLSYLTGVSQKRIDQIKEGKLPITRNEAYKLSMALGVESEDLVASWIWSEAEKCSACNSSFVAQRGNKFICNDCNEIWSN